MKLNCLVFTCLQISAASSTNSTMMFPDLNSTPLDLNNTPLEEVDVYMPDVRQVEEEMLDQQEGITYDVLLIALADCLEHALLVISPFLVLIDI